MTTYILRLVWIASQVLALCAGEDRKSGCRWWCWYLGASLLLSVTYWPELMGAAWYEAFWAPLLAVVVLRTVAALEALHYQTEDFPLWSRMMAGVFLMAVAVVLSVWELRAGTSAETAVQLRRYLQLWTGAAVLLTWGMLWSVGLLRWRRQDQHSAIVGMLALVHLVVTIAGLHYPNPGDGTVSEKIQYQEHWRRTDRAATVGDAALYLLWALTIRGRRAPASPATQRCLSEIAPSASGLLPIDADVELCKADSLRPLRDTPIA